MMVGLLVATHGTLASGIESALSLLAGKPENFGTLELHSGMDPASFKDLMSEKIDELDAGDGVLVLLDIFGGTPSNSFGQLMGRDNIRAIAGVNLPMAIEAVFSRPGLSLDELSARVAETGRDATVDVWNRFRQAAEEDDEEDF